jgi:hypothetical protein
MSTIGTGSTSIPAAEQKGPVAFAFDEGMSFKRRRQDKMNRIADLIKPSIRWREEGEDEGADTVQLRQSVGMLGLAATRGAMTEGKWPLGENPIAFDLDIPADKIKEYGEDRVQSARQWLDEARHRLWNLLLSAKTNMKGFAGGRDFRSSMALQDDFSLVHGDCCIRIRKDLLVEVYLPGQWICVRDGQGSVLRIVVVCKIDPDTLDDDKFSKCNLPAGWMSKPITERMVKVYVNYEIEDGKWNLTEECNGQTIHTETHEEARIFSLPWDLIPGNQYGDSYFEAARGKLKNLDHLAGTKTDLVNLIGDVKIGIHTGSSIRPARLVGPSGSIIENANISGGVWNDVGVLSIDKHQDLNEVRNEHRLDEEALAKMLGVELEMIPKAERTTRLAVQETVARMNATRGGQVVGYFSQCTVLVVRAAVDVAISEGLFGKVPDDIKEIINGFWRVSFTAGAATLARTGNAQKVLGFCQAVSLVDQTKLPDDMDKGDLYERIARDMGVQIKRFTKAEMQARQQAASNAAIQQQAALETAKAAAPIVADRAFGPGA